MGKSCQCRHFHREVRSGDGEDKRIPESLPRCSPSLALGPWPSSASAAGGLRPPACIPAPTPSSDHQLWSSPHWSQDICPHRCTSDAWNIISLAKKIPSHLQDSISRFSWNVVKICVFAMGTFRSRGLCGSSYKMVCLSPYFHIQYIFSRSLP